MKSRKNVPIWQKRKCCFAKTMHQFTHTLSRWPQSISSNRLLAHPIRQIQLPRIVFSSKAQKNGSTFKDFLKMKRYQPPAKYKAEWRFHRRRIGSREGFLGFNRYAQTRPRRVLYNVFQSFCHFTSSPKKKKNNEEVESAVTGYFEELNGSHYKQGIEAIKHRQGKCIELKGDYAEE